MFDRRRVRKSPPRAQGKHVRLMKRPWFASHGEHRGLETGRTALWQKFWISVGGKQRCFLDGGKHEGGLANEQSAAPHGSQTPYIPLADPIYGSYVVPFGARSWFFFYPPYRALFVFPGPGLCDTLHKKLRPKGGVPSRRWPRPEEVTGLVRVMPGGQGELASQTENVPQSEGLPRKSNSRELSR